MIGELCEMQVRESKVADRRQSGFVNALRVHKALTADLEKRVLVWLAIRTPRFINSDYLTTLRTWVAIASAVYVVILLARAVTHRHTVDCAALIRPTAPLRAVS